LWGERAYGELDATLRHTAVGYATHHASSVMWATIFERWLNYSGALQPGKIVRDAAAMTAIASLVDYRLTPPRLRPGFERHLSRDDACAVHAEADVRELFGGRGTETGVSGDALIRVQHLAYDDRLRLSHDASRAIDEHRRHPDSRERHRRAVLDDQHQSAALV